MFQQGEGTTIYMIVYIVLFPISLSVFNTYVEKIGKSGDARQWDKATNRIDVAVLYNYIQCTVRIFFGGKRGRGEGIYEGRSDD